MSLEAANAAPIPLLLTQPLLDLRQQLEFVASAPPVFYLYFSQPYHFGLLMWSSFEYHINGFSHARLLSIESAPNLPLPSVGFLPPPPPIWPALSAPTIRRSKSVCRHSSASSARCSRRHHRSTVKAHLATRPPALSIRAATTRPHPPESRLPRNHSMHSTRTFPMRAIVRPHRSTLCFRAQLCRLLLRATAGAAARTAISIPSRCHDWANVLASAFVGPAHVFHKLLFRPTVICCCAQCFLIAFMI